MPADTKLYLYLDPGRLIGDAASTLDPRQFAGWVPHQHIAYLWPAGPWFWLFERLGVPDWVAHRLWIGTLLLAAGSACAGRPACSGSASSRRSVAAIVYQLSPYVLPYVSRTSVMLLPWAGLGWIVGFTIGRHAVATWRRPCGDRAAWCSRSGRSTPRRLAMIVPAPVLWLVHAAWQRAISWRQALVVARDGSAC